MQLDPLAEKLAKEAYPDDLAVREYELDVLVTVERYRRHGLGKAMVDHLEAVVCFSEAGCASG